MPKVAVHNTKGEQVGELELSDKLFAAEISDSAMHQVVVAYLANQRRGTASTKTRSDVRGGGRKPWRQKGTGRARHGTIRSPIWKGGGVVFGPNPRDYSIHVPKKLKRKALKSALTAKLNNNQIYVLDELALEEPKTSEVARMLKSLSIEGTAMFVSAGSEPNLYKSTRNIPGVKSSAAESINTYDVIKSGALVLTKDAVARIEEVFA